jgi:hypothetical protein
VSSSAATIVRTPGFNIGGLRPSADADADSVVAIDAVTGRRAWAFQLVHHDLWDYDTSAQPLFFTLHGRVPAIAVTNKTGMVYVLDRRTGAPLYPVQERPVPASDVIGEHASPTQPFSGLPALGPSPFRTHAGGAFRDSGTKASSHRRPYAARSNRPARLAASTGARQRSTRDRHLLCCEQPLPLRRSLDEERPHLDVGRRSTSRSSLSVLDRSWSLVARSLGIGYFRRSRGGALLARMVGGGIVCVALEQSPGTARLGRSTPAPSVPPSPLPRHVISSSI